MLVVPAVTPVTTPVEPTVALALLALQVPPVVASVSVMVADTHTEDEPFTVPALADGVTVTIWVA